MSVDRTLVGLERDAVDRVEQLRAREDASRLAREGGQESELGRSQVYGPAGDRHAHPRKVELDVADADELAA